MATASMAAANATLVSQAPRVNTVLPPVCVATGSWTGPNCTLPACSLDCQHGGQANPQCNYCFNCLGAWQGPTCSTYNASAAASGIYKPLFASLTTAARVHVAAAPSTSLYPPIPGWRWLGFSYDITKLQHSQIPALALNFTSPAHHWVSGNNTVFGLPDQMTVRDIDPTATSPPTVSCATFESLDAYFQAQASRTNNLHAVVGSASSTDPQSLATQLFPNAQLATICTATYALYQTSSPLAAATTSSHWMGDALASLPVNYTSATRSVFDAFIGAFGTHYVSNITMGAQLNLVLAHAPCLANKYGPSQLELYATKAITNVLDGATWSTNLPPTFTGATRLLATPRQGGDPSAPSVPAWHSASSLLSNPVPVAYTLTDLTALAARVSTAPGSALQIALQEAVNTYVAAGNGALQGAINAANAATAAQWAAAQPVTAAIETNGGPPLPQLLQVAGGSPGGVVTAAARGGATTVGPSGILHMSNWPSSGNDDESTNLCFMYRPFAGLQVAQALCRRSSSGDGIQAGFVGQQGTFAPYTCLHWCHQPDVGPCLYNGALNKPYLVKEQVLLGAQASPVAQGAAACATAGGALQLRVYPEAGNGYQGLALPPSQVYMDVAFDMRVTCCQGGAQPDGSCVW